MKSLYALFKVFAVILSTLTIYSVYIVGYGCLRLIGKSTQSWLNRILRFWGKTCAWFLSISVETSGEKPDPPFFLVSNHLSYVDIIVLFKELNTTFVAKSEVADWPVLGFIAKSIGIVFIDRKNRMDISRVNREISAKVSSDRGLTLFPEGTTSPGAKILRLRPSLLEYPAKSELGAHYCCLHYSIDSGKQLAHEIVSWWGDTPLHTHLFRLAKETSITAEITFGQNILHDSDRKRLAEKLHQKMSDQFKPMCQIGDTSYEPIQF